MRDRLRNLLRGKMLRQKLRDKTMRAIDEAVRGYHDEHTERLRALQQELPQLRADVNELHEALEKTTSEHAQRVLDRVVEFEVRSRRDIVYAADRRATQESAEFVREHMPTARRFTDPSRTLEYALSLAPSGGMALEFGVYSGQTLRIISDSRPGNVYGFDSFEGLPEDWRTDFEAGSFNTDKLPDVPGAELVVGWFGEVLPGFLAEHPGKVDFLHVDSDLHSSAETVLSGIGPRLRPGSVIIFDEYFNYPGWQQHEHRAWREHVERTGTTFSYLGYTHNNEQVVIQVDENPSSEAGPELHSS